VLFSSGFRQREPEAKEASFANDRFHFHATAVAFHNSLHERQSKARPSRRHLLGFRGPIKFMKDQGHFIGPDPDP
jgi:hypothetical protein